MKLDDFPQENQARLMPAHAGRMAYRCLGCSARFGIERLLYVCPECGQVLLIEDQDFERLKATPGRLCRRVFDYRKMLTLTALKGIYRYHEFIGPVIPLDAVLYLGEGHPPVARANAPLRDEVGLDFYFKNDGQYPSASFKDRGMALMQIIMAVQMKNKVRNHNIFTINGVITLVFGLLLFFNPMGAIKALLVVIGLLALVAGVLLVYLGIQVKGSKQIPG